MAFTAEDDVTARNRANDARAWRARNDPRWRVGDYTTLTGITAVTTSVNTELAMKHSSCAR